MWYDREYVMHHIWEIGVLRVRCLLLTPPVGYVRYPKCTAHLHWVGVVIIEIWINLPPSFFELQGANSDTPMRRSIRMVRDRLVLVFSQPHCSALCILHHCWMNHMDWTIIDRILKPLRRGWDCSLVSFRVYWPAHLDDRHSIRSPHISEWPIGIG